MFHLVWWVFSGTYPLWSVDNVWRQLWLITARRWDVFLRAVSSEVLAVRQVIRGAGDVSRQQCEQVLLCPGHRCKAINDVRNIRRAPWDAQCCNAQLFSFQSFLQTAETATGATQGRRILNAEETQQYKLPPFESGFHAYENNFWMKTWHTAFLLDQREKSVWLEIALPEHKPNLAPARMARCDMNCVIPHSISTCDCSVNSALIVY